MDPPDKNFQNALARFRASLTEQQRREFAVCSIKDVLESIAEIDGRLASGRRQRNTQRIAKFIEGMRQLSQVIEVFLNVDPVVAFVWAPIKFVLVVSRNTRLIEDPIAFCGPDAPLKAASTWTETLDCLLDTFAEIAEVLPGLTQYARVLAKHPHIRVHLENYYCDVLEFHQKALEVFSRPGKRTRPSPLPLFHLTKS